MDPFGLQKWAKGVFWWAGLCYNSTIKKETAESNEHGRFLAAL
jgi:hypothetical protein